MTPKIYLFFQGDCFEAMSFYAQLLGGEVMTVHRNVDAPTVEDRMPGPDASIMNMSMRLGDAIIMASDSPPEWYGAPHGFRVQVEPRDRSDFDRIFSGLSENARSIEMAPGETFWAERFALVTDRFGTPWMLNHEGSKAQGAAS